MSDAAQSFTIDKVYPWGRRFDEYSRMFDLARSDLGLRILAVADGPASFNAEMAWLGHKVVSCDPLYGFCADEILARVLATVDGMRRLVQENAHRFIWKDIPSPGALVDLRLSAMRLFLSDYGRGIQQGRYLSRSLPSLGFDDDSFDLALCSHFLFLYADEFPLQFHIDSALELVRLARDARIFPLLDLRGEPSRHVDGVVEAMRKRKLQAERQTVDYEFQRGGNEMLRITR